MESNDARHVELREALIKVGQMINDMREKDRRSIPPEFLRLIRAAIEIISPE